LSFAGRVLQAQLQEALAASEAQLEVAESELRSAHREIWEKERALRALAVSAQPQ
jgi:hypothetical protein